MKVIHIPYSSDNNPYQKLLFDNLQKLEIVADGVPARRLLSLMVTVIKNWKPNIIHLHWQHSFVMHDNVFIRYLKAISFIAELLLLRLLGIKLVWTVHNLKHHEKKHQEFELFFTKLLAHLSNGLIAHCEKAKTQIKKEFSIKNGAKISVIPHGNYLSSYENSINRNDARNELGISSSSFVFLHIGLIRPYKGTLELIDSFKMLKLNKTRLIIAGEPCNKEMDNLVREKIDDDDHINFIPEFVPDNKVQVYMQASDVVVFAYREILTSGGVILAMSFGKPILAPAMNCISDMLDDRGSFLYKTKNEDGLLIAMSKSVESEKRLNEMGRHNLHLAKQLDWNETAEHTYKLYKQVLII
jgi:glycosyltransferase involved in cell wall biosynthesis